MSRLMQDTKLWKVKAAAKALSDPANKIPEKKRQELSLIVQNFSASALTPDVISEAATMEVHKENANSVSHAFVVVKRVCEDGNLSEFMKMWRRLFVRTMRPQHLPTSWSVDHGHEGLKGKLRDSGDQL